MLKCMNYRDVLTTKAVFAIGTIKMALVSSFVEPCDTSLAIGKTRVDMDYAFQSHYLLSQMCYLRFGALPLLHFCNERIRPVCLNLPWLFCLDPQYFFQRISLSHQSLPLLPD